jgi:hypothetical protein
MSGYTVTITPSGGQSGPQTTIQVDTTSGAARVTELTVRAGGSGLSPQELPVFDLAALVAALAPGSAAPALTAAPSAPVAAQAEAPARGRRGRKATAEAPKKATRGRRRAAAAEEAPAKAGRAYRRMPAQDEVLAAWNETRSATQVANHFDVPRHTATGWLRRLRQMGVIES